MGGIIIITLNVLNKIHIESWISCPVPLKHAVLSNKYTLFHVKIRFPKQRTIICEQCRNAVSTGGGGLLNDKTFCMLNRGGLNSRSEMSMIATHYNITYT